MATSNPPEERDGVRPSADDPADTEQAAVNSFHQTQESLEGRTQEQNLSTLLDNEDLLSRVLKEVLDDGLHECRRVCRKWRDVCNTLPVKLTVSSKHAVSEAPRMFPNSTDLSFSGSFDAICFNPDTGVGPSLQCLLSSTAQLTNLRRLSIDPRENVYTVPSTREFPASVMFRLHELRLKTFSENNFEVLLDGVRALTNLTSLKLRWISFGSRVSMEPLTELRKLRHLDLSAQFFVDGDGTLLFPYLPHLTHLGLHNMKSCALLEKTSEICGASLRSLAFHNHRTVGTLQEWSRILLFPKLETLDLGDSLSLKGEVEDVVCQLTYLKNLAVFDDNSSNASDTTKMLSSMYNLKSLGLAAGSSRVENNLHDQMVDISHLTRLTRLKLLWWGGEIQFQSITSLVQLHIQLSTTLDLSHSISHLSLLERLTLVNRKALCIKHPSVLRNLKSLKSVALSMPNDISGDFFPALGSLPALTQLGFCCQEYGTSVSSLVQISLVTGLRDLDFCDTRVHSLCLLPAESLPRLRTLRVLFDTFTEEARTVLRNKLPCLNRIKLSSLFDYMLRD